ncbi:zinc knuckle CX2CX4HX4C containing protein [Tanacetum coccineum]|uniref:Zinc knuckle CX2CX4HX4C containing protein n=1 Tax=Tanacetum coccineum TaxID=301880 RepID=A0ABQ4XXM2_9ASTR
MIHNTPIILKKWSMSTSLLKQELTRIPIWVELHDVPLQVFEEDDISLIATFIGKPIMLDSYTSSMCKDSWGRSSFARCLTEVNSEVDLVDVVTIGIPSLTGDDFTKETIRVEYEWRPPKCDECKIFGHVHYHCPKKVASLPIVTTSNVVAPTVVKSNDGFQMVGKKKKRKGKSKSTNGGQFVGPSVKQTIIYETNATTSAPKKVATNVSNPSKSSSMLKTTDTSPKNDNFTTFNSFSALNDEEDDDEEVENVYDESANLSPNTNTGGSSSFTGAAGRVFCKKGCNADGDTWEECLSSCDEICYKDPVLKDQQWSAYIDRSPGSATYSQYEIPSEKVTEVHPNRPCKQPPPPPPPAAKTDSAVHKSIRISDDIPSTSA